MKVCICIDRHSIFGYSFMVESKEECKEEENEDFACDVLEEDDDYHLL